MPLAPSTRIWPAYTSRWGISTPRCVLRRRLARYARPGRGLLSSAIASSARPSAGGFEFDPALSRGHRGGAPGVHARSPAGGRGGQRLGLLCQALIAKGDLRRGRGGAAGSGAAARVGCPRSGVLGVAAGCGAAKQAQQASDGARREPACWLRRKLHRRAAPRTAGPPASRLEYQRGNILLAQGRIRQGLEALEEAIGRPNAGAWPLLRRPRSSTAWPRNFSPTPSTGLWKPPPATASGPTSGRRWAEESFEATELNRGVNLRDSASSTWRRTLPAEYWEDLGRLQPKRAGCRRRTRPRVRFAERLRLKLTELERKPG